MRSALTHLVVTALALASGCRERANPKDDPPPSKPKPADLAQPASAPNWAQAIKIDFRYDPTKSAVVAHLVIAPGYHTYTEGETIGRPLKLEVALDSDLKPDGPAIYPAGITKDLPIGRSVIVEGEAEVVAKLAAPTAGKSAKGTLMYQVCTDDACDRPKTMPWTVAVN